MLIFLDFLIRLAIHETCGHDDPKLTVTKSRYQPRHLSHADRILDAVAFGLEREIDQD
jgi:hypothetical protein